MQEGLNYCFKKILIYTIHIIYKKKKKQTPKKQLAVVCKIDFSTLQKKFLLWSQPLNLLQNQCDFD